ncbi:hypothetical protein [Thomasclavelia cocleata]|jgi:hypothetical protein|uniref:hypothetical protein n=1 Tax=Thomasclavelia cocleata TaxID=69824 RepID=UPI00241CD73F|nr:hypothetical protein [Thomasclavelia cocleata]
MHRKLSKAIIIETVLIILCLCFAICDYFSSHYIFDLFIHFEKSETLVVEQQSPDCLSTVRIYQLEPSSLSNVSIRVDFTPNNSKKTYSYFTSIYAEDIPIDNEFYHIQWQNNVPSIYLSGNSTISINYTE